LGKEVPAALNHEHRSGGSERKNPDRNKNTLRKLSQRETGSFKIRCVGRIFLEKKNGPQSQKGRVCKCVREGAEVGKNIHNENPTETISVQKEKHRYLKLQYEKSKEKNDPSRTLVKGTRGGKPRAKENSLIELKTLDEGVEKFLN